MRSILLSTFLLMLSQLMRAQNLVPNPSFEEYFSCPNTYGESFELRDWYMALATPDYYNRCDGANDTCGVPRNFTGYQEPATGDAYIGMVTYSNDPPFGFRELIGVKLLEPLVVGETYYASFKVSCTNGYPNLDGWTRYAANKLGIRIRQDSLDSWFPPDNIAQFASDSVVTDSVGWTLLSGSFQAQESAQWLFLGNFFDHPSVSTAVIDPDCPDEQGYYYFDDACLSLNPSECPMATMTPGFDAPISPRAWAAPGSGSITIESLAVGRAYRFELVNAVGKLLAQGRVPADGAIPVHGADQLVVLRLWDGSGEHRFKLPVLSTNP